MDFAYQDIIGLQRPDHANDAFGRAHPRMTRLNRAKLFAPYAALRGFEACVEAKRVRYEPRHIPDADEEYELNRRIGILYGLCRNGRMARANRVTVRVEYFVPCADVNHAAFGRQGQYRTVDGVVTRVDIPGQRLTVGGLDIAFSDIYSIDDPAGQRFAVRRAPDGDAE